MVFKIALLLKEHFRERISSYMSNKPEDVVIDFIPYSTVREVQDIFLSIKDQYDGFFVSGLIPFQAIKILGEKSEDAIIGHASVNVENALPGASPPHCYGRCGECGSFPRGDGFP